MFLSTLALSLLRVSSPPSESFVLSPFSLGTALAIIHDGTGGNTQAQLTKLLVGDNLPSSVTSFYSQLIWLLTKPSNNVTINMANKLFLKKDFDTKPSFSAHISKNYNADIEKLDFTDGEASAEVVNSFVRNKTDGMISQLVEAEDIEESVALLINAVFFEGAWKHPFVDGVRVGVFHGIEGDREVPFMFAEETRVYYSSYTDLTAVSIPYQDPSYSFFIIMPNSNFSKWREELVGYTLGRILEEREKREIDLRIPKFKIESSLNGKAALQKLGVNEIFSPSNLSGISDDPRLYVSDVVQKAAIDVSEIGTRAAATSFVNVKLLSARPDPPAFKADRPFLYGIIHGSHILFIGQYV